MFAIHHLRVRQLVRTILAYVAGGVIDFENTGNGVFCFMHPCFAGLCGIKACGDREAVVAVTAHAAASAVRRAATNLAAEIALAAALLGLAGAEALTVDFHDDGLGRAANGRVGRLADGGDGRDGHQAGGDEGRCAFHGSVPF